MTTGFARSQSGIRPDRVGLVGRVSEAEPARIRAGIGGLRVAYPPYRPKLLECCSNLKPHNMDARGRPQDPARLHWRCIFCLTLSQIYAKYASFVVVSGLGLSKMPASLNANADSDTRGQAWRGAPPRLPNSGPRLSPPFRDKQPEEGQVCGGPTARCQAPGRLPSTYNCELLLFSLRRFHRTGANFGSAGPVVR